MNALTVDDDTKAKILIVDDNGSNTKLLEALLRRNGFTELDSTTNPLEALALFDSFKPDLLLLDLQMPKLDGFAILRSLQDRVADMPYFPVLVLTADVTPEAKHRALRSGAKDFVTKPFDHEEVLLRVRNLLETRRLHQALGSHNQILKTEVEERTRLLLHTLVNKISILSNYAQLLRESALSEDQSEMVDEMTTAAEKAIESHRLLEKGLGF